MTTNFLFSGFDDSSRWVLPAALAEQADRQPDATWVTTTDGERLHFGEAWHDARRIAGWLVSLGVKPGDRVALMMGNHLDFVRAWTGLGVLGAVGVLLNTELQGAFLAHQLRNCEARLAIVDGVHRRTVEDASRDVPTLERLIVAPRCDTAEHRPPCLAWDGWKTAEPHTGPLPSAQDIACVMYTSGTSGPAKGVLMPHAHCTLYGVGTIQTMGVEPDDRYYVTLPLFHANGLLMQLGASLLGGVPVVLRPRFSASAWMADIRTHGATVTNLVGSTAAFVIAQPPGAGDAQHRLRALCLGPNLATHDAEFRTRFGIAEVVSGFGMTEVNIPTWGRLGQPCPGAAGWVHDAHFEVVIADPATDRELPRGSVGEILVRPKVPFGFMAGYLGMPERTAEAWRNLWFHTGDAAVMGEDGLLTFVDRLKDCIRRRGENISATEVEEQVATLAGIEHVAAYAVPSGIPGGEDALVVAVVADAALSCEAIVAHADRVLPRFARIDHVRRVSELPRTATGKVQRAVLRQAGVDDAWHRPR